MAKYYEECTACGGTGDGVCANCGDEPEECACGDEQDLTECDQCEGEGEIPCDERENR